MRKIFLFSLLLVLSATTFSQQTNPSSALSKQDYLKKSKRQKIAAFSLLGGGSILWLAGLNKYMNQEDNIDGGGEAAMIIGGVAGLSSIPLFIISSKNKKKAMSISLKSQMVSQFQGTGFVYTPLPSLNLKITL